MKKHIAYLFVLLIFAAVGLSSCTDTTDLENQIAILQQKVQSLESTPSTNVDISSITSEIAALSNKIATLSPSDQKVLEELISRIVVLEKAIEKNNFLPQGTHNGHDYVDLGLSVKWATCNIGAKSPEDRGNYYAWAETTPAIQYGTLYHDFNTNPAKLYFKDTDNDKEIEYQEPSYLYYDDETKNFIKYTDGDKLTCLQPSDDVAHVNWGGNWRMPTEDDIEALHKICTIQHTEQKGISGSLYTSILNGNSIFLPDADNFYVFIGLNSIYPNEDIEENYGDYWSSSLSSHNHNTAYCFSFWKNIYYGERKNALLVRPVCTIPTKYTQIIQNDKFNYRNTCG